MILHRCFAWRSRARPSDPDGPLFFARQHQGRGRHDNPEVYGCLYLADREVSAVVEQLAPFRGQALAPYLLVRRGLPLALAAIELADAARLVDLDDPATLSENSLRPSLVATRRRALTQAQALALFHRHRRAVGLRWWSTFESLWANVTLFDRGEAALRLVEVARLELDSPAAVEAAETLGFAA